MGLKGGTFFQFSNICLHFSAVCLQFIKKKSPHLKRILAKSKLGQTCTVSVLQPFFSDFFQTVAKCGNNNYLNIQTSITFTTKSSSGVKGSLANVWHP